MSFKHELGQAIQVTISGEKADEIIEQLSRAVKYDMATEEEKLRLAAWEKYSVLVSRIKPEDAPEIEWPKKPE